MIHGKKYISVLLSLALVLSLLVIPAAAVRSDIEVGPQVGTLTEGTSGTATYSVATPGVKSSLFLPVVQWQRNGSWSAIAPNGVAAVYSARDKAVKVRTTASAAAGEYSFRLVAATLRTSYTSVPATLTVGAKQGGSAVCGLDISYKADDTAMAIAQSGSVTTLGDLLVLAPSGPTDTAIIFYPGANVQAEAYLPILDQLRNNGILCILVQMPLNMAIFDANAADAVMDMAEFSHIDHWYLAGHSLGGTMASTYASANADKLDGLLLLSAYVFGTYPLDDALTVFGSRDLLVKPMVLYKTNVVEIQGGNHAQFGNYGAQVGDRSATISAQTQQAVAVDAILAFLAARAD